MLIADRVHQEKGKVLPDPFGSFLLDLEYLGVHPTDSGNQAFAILGARSNRRWYLLPLADRKALRCGLQMLQPVTWKARIAQVLIGWAAGLVKQGFLGSRYISLSGPPDLGLAFKGVDVNVAYFTGTDGPHRKTAIQVMDRDASVIGYAKLSRKDHIRPYLRNEAQVLERLAGVNLITAEVPKLLDLKETPDVTLLITDGFAEPRKRVDVELTSSHSAFLSELREKTASFGAHQVLGWLLSESTRLVRVAGTAWSERLRRVVDDLEGKSNSIEVGLAHGDFTPWNCILGKSGLYVFDWEYAQDSWPIGFDIVHFKLAVVRSEGLGAQMDALRESLAAMCFGGDEEKARNAILLSLACHAAFYLGRLEETSQSMDCWPDGLRRAAFIDLLLG